MNHDNLQSPSQKFIPINPRKIYYPLCWKWAIEVINLNCKTRILWVMDGSLSLNPEAGFSLSEAKSIVEVAANTNHPIELTTAHRSNGIGCDISGFRFDTPHVVNGDERSISYYDEIWIFSYNSSGDDPNDPDALDEQTELPAITTFMNNGGGVFATGDHADLGAALCENIPRVKSMRKWRVANGAPTGGQSTRIDTNVPSPHFGPQFDLQSDNVPQRIYPTWQSDDISDYQPHPLLEMPNGNVVCHLPDHPHEGLCVVPDILDPIEYPNSIAPEVIAYGVSGGPGFRSDKPSITPPVLFGILGAYDGHQASIGRVVVDSTWHHWLNVNLNGTGESSNDGPNDDINKRGLYDVTYDLNGDPVFTPTREYREIQTYFQNIASWIEPNRFKLCFIVRFICIRWSWPLIEEFVIYKKPTFKQLVSIGQSVEESIKKFQGNNGVNTVVDQLLELGDFSKTIRNSFNTLYRGKDKLTVSTLFKKESFIHVILGGAMHQLGQSLPTSEYETKKHVKKLSKKIKNEQLDKKEPLVSALIDGVKLGVDLLNDELCHSDKLHHDLGDLI